MADPKEGYVSGIDIAVVGDVDSNGVFDGNTPKEGFNSGVVKYTSVTVDADGVVTPAGNYSGIHRAVNVSVDANGDYSSNLPKEGFNSGAYRYSTSTNASKEGDIEGYGVILGTIDSSGDFQTYSPDAWLLNGSDQYLLHAATLPRHQEDEAAAFTCGFTLAGTAATTTFIYGQNDARFIVHINTANKIRVFGRSIAGATNIDVATDDTVAHDSAVHALAISFDLSTASPVLTIVLDGVVQAYTGSVVGESVIDFQASQQSVGGEIPGGINLHDGCLWNIGLDHNTSVSGLIPDYSVAADRDAVMSGNQMKDPGSDGSDYFKQQPIIMLQNPVATAGTNTGQGGNFTKQGVSDFRCLRVGPDIGNPPLYVSIHLWESTYSKYAQPTTPPDYGLADFADVAEAENVTIGYIIDDANQLETNMMDNINAFIARGHNFGIEPIGSDSLLAGASPFEGPVEIQYDGVGTNPTLTISDGGKTWALTADGVLADADNHTYSDVSAGTVYEKLKWGLLLGTVDGALGIDEQTGWTADINSFYSASFDDAFSESLAVGTYVLTGVPPKTIEPEFNQLRRKELEIDYAITTMLSEGLTAWSKVFYNPSWNATNDTVETFLRTQSIYKDDWTGIIGWVGDGIIGDSDATIAYSSPISGLDPWQIVEGLSLEGTPTLVTDYFKGDLATYDALSSTEQEHQIRLTAKGLSCEAGKVNAYIPIIFPHVWGRWTPTEVGWLINELKAQNCQIISIDNAVSRF